MKKGNRAGTPKTSPGSAGRGASTTGTHRVISKDLHALGGGRTRSWSGTVGPEAGEGMRADLFIADIARVLSRSQIKARGAEIVVGGKVAKASRLLHPGEELEVRWTEELGSDLVPENLPLSVIYEDSRCIVIDKAQGMVTHPGHGNRRSTLANALLGRWESGSRVVTTANPSGKGEGAPSGGEGRHSSERGGIVHRLDKDTSGLIIAARDLEAQVFLAAQFKDRSAKKEYLALLRGRLPESNGRIADRLGRDRRDRKRFTSVSEGGKAAITDWKLLGLWLGPEGRGGAREAFSLVSLRPKTGRTHQLRVHMASLGCPILGDPIYGKKDGRFPEASLMLHAYKLRIIVPGESGARLFTAPPPQRFKVLAKALNAAFGKPLRS